MSGRSSCIYEGLVRHRRYLPRGHALQYRLFMLYLDLDELPTVFAGSGLCSVEGRGLARFRRRDHLRNEAAADQPLGAAVRDLVARRLGWRPEGPIRLLTHLEYFRHRFNPVSFYYCFDAGDTRVQAIVAEINNTPWGEQHCYVLDASKADPRRTIHRFRFAKEFHISPFFGMDQQYDWRFGRPGRRLGVHMETRQGDAVAFDATMSLRRIELTPASLRAAIWRFPAMTVQVVAAIYWQALRLWLKRVGYFPHPNSPWRRPAGAPEAHRPARGPAAAGDSYAS